MVEQKLRVLSSSKVPDELFKKFKEKCARLGLKTWEGIAQAVQEWVKK